MAIDWKARQNAIDKEVAALNAATEKKASTQPRWTKAKRNAIRFSIRTFRVFVAFLLGVLAFYLAIVALSDMDTPLAKLTLNDLAGCILAGVGACISGYGMLITGFGPGPSEAERVQKVIDEATLKMDRFKFLLKDEVASS